MTRCTWRFQAIFSLRYTESAKAWILLILSLKGRISFPKEYDIAAKAAELIGQTFDIEVPEDEIGFLTYHVYSAVSHVPVGHLVKASNVVGNLVRYIEEERQVAFDRKHGLCPSSDAFEVLGRPDAESRHPSG